MEAMQPSKRRKVGDAKDISVVKAAAAVAVAATERLPSLRRREAALLAELEETRRLIKHAYAEGGIEENCILIIGTDSLSHVMNFLDFRSAGRFEGVCKLFRERAVEYWETLDSKIPEKGRSADDSARSRVIRYKLAEEICMYIEPRIALHETKVAKTLVPTVYPDEKHRFLPEGKWRFDTTIDVNSGNQFEYFLRFSRRDDEQLLAQGFVGCKFNVDPEIFPEEREKFLNINDLDLTRWSDMREIVHLPSTGESYSFHQLEKIVSPLMNNLVVTVVAVSKEMRPNLRLIAAHRNHETPEDDYMGINESTNWALFPMQSMPRAPYDYYSFEETICTSFYWFIKHEDDAGSRYDISDGDYTMKLRILMDRGF